jgi:hypothetical protein
VQLWTYHPADFRIDDPALLVNDAPKGKYWKGSHRNPLHGYGPTRLAAMRVSWPYSGRESTMRQLPSPPACAVWINSLSAWPLKRKERQGPLSL